jgi:uncharacterized protein (TIGR00297 family)
MDFLTGFLLALAIAAVARLLHSLTNSGAAAAVVLGTVVYGFGGWQAATLLITFFIGSSMVGRVAKPRDLQSEAKYAKGSVRDAGQVLGNGIVAGALSVAISAQPLALWPWLGYAGAVAAVNADTWATELGALSKTPPILITHPGERVSAGTSGGVTTVGTLAALLGATAIAGISVLVNPTATKQTWAMLPVLVGGFAGALFDSYAGATVQAMYRCSRDGTETEQHPFHRCGAVTERVRGWAWLNNDRVNLACSLAGASTAIGIGVLCGWA